MNFSYEEAVRRGWVKPEDVPAAAKKARRGKGKREAEGEEQAELVAEFRKRYPVEGLLLIHIPNGGFRKNAFEGWRLKQQGVRAGVSDLFLPVARGGFFGLWIEFKAAPPNDAQPTDDQLEWLELMRAQGYHAELCLGVEAALAVLDRYMAPEPTRVSRRAVKRLACAA
ncbi:VRR-NUC domain-containing protein [Paraburkholderia aspalathi]|nr:VRR-NUC domain-containing protein [Paraburkholderia aspalathi]MBK3779857.1 VRR-NUC domain-containing protein [Paraburkholderia aspalathi]